MTQLPQQNTDISQIAHYSILSCIGRGGMGLVYLARDTRLDRQVAIKCLRTELFEPHYRERFKREALLLAKLNHPNIVQIYDYVETDTQLALVMEYVAGQNLQQHLRENIVSLAQRMQWLTQIAQGLAVAHDTGIIHRDLKAENILINQHKLAKITDLGIAKSQDFNATLTDHVTGSYGSMSPEQAMGEELDFRSDLFSFGILAYQLLCGVHPFGDTQNKLQLMQRIISHPPIAPTKNNPDLLPEVVELLGQLLSKNPDNRPVNTHWVAAQCEKLYQLIAQNTVADTDNTQMLPHANTSHSGIRKTDNKKNNLRYTQEHPTFETRFEKNKTPIIKIAKNYIRENSVTLICGSLALLMILGAVIWQLQPKQPKYIAVLSPSLTADGMQESQQELVKGAVYDAIQQSVLQLDGYYLIPRNEISDINATNNKEGIETVRKATAADELITTDIQCKIESCTIMLSRLTPDGEKQESRLKVQDTKTVDVLTDNYLSVATIVQNNIGALYAEGINNEFEKINQQEYAKVLEMNRTYIGQGASREILEQLEKLEKNTKALPSVQTLYSDVALDLHYETQDPKILEKLETLFEISTIKKNDITHLKNLFYLKIAQKKFPEAEAIIENIRKNNGSDSMSNELYAYSRMAQKNYASAITFYEKSFSVKVTANNLYYIAISYWFWGKPSKAQKYIHQSLELSPNLYKAIGLNGTISLLEGNIDEAKKLFERAIKQKPTDPIAINNLGFCYLLEKKPEIAIGFFKKTSSSNPEDIMYKLNLADAENIFGNKQKAETLYNEIISHEMDAHNIDLLRYKTQAYSQLKRVPEALTALQKLEQEDPQNIMTIYTAALVHTLANNKASAILNIEKNLSSGMGAIWFSFVWFNTLCDDNDFINLMKKNGAPDRCPIPTTNIN